MPTILTEQVDLTEAQFDREARVLRNVKLIKAGTSLNRRHYSEDVLRKAAPLFDGVKSFDGHEQRQRRVAETTGWYANPVYRDCAIYADRHFSGTQAGRDVMSVVEDIVGGHAPKSLAGLSINAVGVGKMQRMGDVDTLVVESITKAESVDDVSTPAAGGSYTESASKSGDALAVALVEAMTYEEFLGAHPEFTERLRREIKQVRMDEQFKTALAESEDKLKTAVAAAEQASAALKEAQASVGALTSERDAALVEAATARRALTVEQTLHDPKRKLPLAWKDALRKALTESEPAQWDRIIEQHRKLASSLGYKPLVTVTGAAQQVDVAPPVRMDESVRLTPTPDEDLTAWLARMAGNQAHAS